MALLVPLVALGLPIMDTLFAMVRRYVERRPIFAPDNGHIHHRLLALGVTHKRAVLILYGVCLVLMLGAIAIALGRSWQVGGALLVLSLLVFGVMRFARYFEQARIGRTSVERLRAPELERMRLAVPPALHAIAGAESPLAIRNALEEFGEDAGILEIHAEGTTPALDVFDWWKDPSGPAPSPREIGTTRSPLTAAGPEGRLRFIWPAVETASAEPQVVVLLQLVVDVTDARLRTLLEDSQSAAKAANPDIRVIARAHSDAEVDHLSGLGADLVIMGEREIARGMVEQVLGTPAAEARNPDSDAAPSTDLDDSRPVIPPKPEDEDGKP